MKRIIFLSLFTCLPRIASSQVVNPTVISQDTDIALHFTDVYYCPMAPPADTDVREWISSMSAIILDSNGVYPNNGYPYYSPITHGMHIQNWNPCGTSLGTAWDRPWQRLFTARDKPNHNHSDIIAGGLPGDSVIISKNEDVDFRASGTIKLENGFHAKPGCFFHAYTEPRWGKAVFSDDFDSTAVDHSKWYVANGSNVESGGVECLADTNVRDTTDPDATDGHALDIMLREDTNKFSTRRLVYSWTDTCNGATSTDTTSYKSVFSSALIRSCPWPMSDRTASFPLPMAYQHLPYGKYEIREKTPHTLHHLNNWLFGSFEVDMDEEGQNNMDIVFPNVHHHLHTGPFYGMFHILPDSSVIFVSHDADWSNVNQPNLLYIDNFAYDVKLLARTDTVVGDANIIGGISNWPASLKYRTDSVTFYYSRNEQNTADNLTWRAYPDSSGKWKIISVPYHVNRLGDTLRFSKNYQPQQITLTTRLFPFTQKTLSCWWDSSLNSPVDRGLLYLRDTELSSDTNTDLHSNTEAYSYSVNEHDFEFQPSAAPFHWGDSDPSTYQYHTFAVELLPNEMRFLIDSNVVLRFPDRMIPPGNRQYDLVHNLDRSPMQFYIGELDIDRNSDGTDLFGTDSTKDTWGNYISTTYRWRKMFEQRAAKNWAGFWPYHGQPTAHKLIDYVRVWDVPDDITVPDFPH